MALIEVFRIPRPGNIPEGTVTVAAADRVEVVAGSFTLELYGQFTHDFEGDLDAGTVTGFELYDANNGGLQYRLSYISVEAWTFVRALTAGPDYSSELWLYGNDTLIGSPGDDYLDGRQGADSIVGGAGNDVLVGIHDYITFGVPSATDTLVGGPGDDVYLVSGTEGGPTDLVIEAVNAGHDRVESLGSYELPDNVEDLILGLGGSSTGRGNALANLIRGNAGANVLEGRGGNDTLEGGGGLDTLRGGDGNDFLVAGAEGTTLDGGTGNDTLQGGLGNDLYIVDAAGDVVLDGGGEDTVRASLDGYVLASGIEHLELVGGARRGFGNAGANRLTGNELGNELSGGAGNDTLDGGTGADTLDGGEGGDTYTVDNVGDVVRELAGGGDDLVSSSVSHTLSDNVERLTLTLAGLTGRGNALANLITGSDGNDTLDGAAGADTLAGGMGADTYVIDEADVIVEHPWDTAIDTIIAGFSVDLAQYALIENVTLTGTAALGAKGNAAHNVLTGNAGDNVLVAIDGDELHGGAGNDMLQGSSGRDILDGGTGADTMIGGLGVDTYYVDSVDDVVIEVHLDEYSFDDRMDWVKSSVSYVLPDDVELLTLIGTAAIDGTGTARRAETIEGNDAANVLDGGGSDGDILYGNGGDDVLRDGGGFVTAYGGTGDDTYEVGGSTRVNEAVGEGIDTVCARGNWWLGANFENLVLVGDAQRGEGNDIDNVITGNALGNFLDGHEGRDTMIGGDGDDFYTVDDRGDVVVELAGGGIDTIQARASYSMAGTQVERLIADWGWNSIDLTGNDLDNYISGNAADNVLDGGAGADTLDGGGGNDTFIVDNAGDVVNGGLGNAEWVWSKLANYTLAAYIENLRLLGSAHSGTGNELGNLLQGNALDNTLDGAAGNDTLFGGRGDDTLVGGQGNDLLDGDAGRDVAVFGGRKADYTITRSGGNVNVAIGAELDVLTGIDVLRFADSDLVLNEHLASGSVGMAGIAEVGRVLTASATGFTDADGLGALSWQWFRNDVEIDGARSADYTAVFADTGAQLQARARFVDGQGNTESIWSAASAPIVGDQKPPKLLSAVVGQVDGYYWRAYLEFDEAVEAGSGRVQVRGSAGTVMVDAAITTNSVAFKGNVLEIPLPNTLSIGQQLHFDLTDGAVTDASGNKAGVLSGALVNPRYVREGTPGNDRLYGTGVGDEIHGGDGDDSFEYSGGSDWFDGGEGHDILVINGDRGAFDVRHDEDGFVVTLRSFPDEANVTLRNVERIHFWGGKVALDIDGNAGQAYRLYKAAFDRVPDIGGLGYQMNDLDHGWALTWVAGNFVASPEFQSTYGTLNDTQFVTQLYWNVLDRAPDAGGLAYHVERLKTVPRGFILAGFSESPENQANVIGAIGNGMEFVWP